MTQEAPNQIDLHLRIYIRRSNLLVRRSGIVQSKNSYRVSFFLTQRLETTAIRLAWAQGMRPQFSCVGVLIHPSLCTCCPQRYTAPVCGSSTVLLQITALTSLSMNVQCKPLLDPKDHSCEWAYPLAGWEPHACFRMVGEDIFLPPAVRKDKVKDHM